MYLIVCVDGTSRQVDENLTIGDYMGVRTGVLQIFRVANDHFERLVTDEDKVLWVPVKNAKLIGCKEAMFHT